MTTRSKDELFQILSNSRRRYIIYYLAQHGAALGLTELATKIAAVETDTPEAEITSDERQRVYISLYQTHLPKLEEAGVVSYDGENRTVSLDDDVREDGFFWMNTDATADGATSWARYSVVLAAAGWLLVAGVATSVPPFTALGWAGVATLITLAVTALAVIQYTRRPAAADQSSGYEILIE